MAKLKKIKYNTISDLKKSKMKKMQVKQMPLKSHSVAETPILDVK
jgi:hypothetical protein